MRVEIKNFFVCGFCDTEHTNMQAAEVCCLSLHALRTKLDAMQLKSNLNLCTRTFKLKATEALGSTDVDIKKLLAHMRGLQDAIINISDKLNERGV